MDRTDTKYSKMLTSRNAGATNREHRAEITLAVEHKIFFNEAYRNEYERNKLPIAKYDKRKKGMLQDKALSTDFEKAIVYEAYDTIYTDMLPLSTHQHGQVKSQLAITLIKGRMSEHMILRVQLESVRSNTL